MTLSIKYFLVFSVPLLILNCAYNDNTRSECSDAICTEQFRNINILIKHTDGDPVSLKSFKVTDLENNKDLTLSLTDEGWAAVRRTGSYPIFNDGYVHEYWNKESRIEFLGFIDNQVVVDQIYTVAANCCHVYLKEGPMELIID